MTSPRCTTWTGRHKYEAVFDDVENVAGLDLLKFAIEHGTMLDDMYPTRKVSVQSICIHCGDVIDRPEKP